MQSTGNPELDREIARLATQVDTLKDLPAHLEKVKGTAEAADGLISVTVDSRGRMEHLEISPHAKRMDSESLTKELLGTAQRAYDDMQQAMYEVMAPSMGSSDALKRVMSGQDISDIPADIFDGPAKIARSADPMSELATQFKRLQGLL